MTLDHPLLELIKHCETICEASCCGREAFDFSPIHIASFLIRYTGRIEPGEIEKIFAQLQELDAESSRLLAEGGTTVIAEMNQLFTGQELAQLSAAIADGVVKAAHLVSIVEKAAQETEPSS